MGREGEVTTRYPAIIDGERGAYGVVIPDMPGACCAMGSTVDEALVNAEDVLADFLQLMEMDGLPLPSPSPIEDLELKAGEMVAYLSLKVPA